MRRQQPTRVWRSLLVGSLALMPAAFAAAQTTTATLIKESPLYSAPFLDAPAQGNLPAETSVSVIGAKGAWSQVNAAGNRSGWVRMLNLRMQTSGQGNAGQGALTAIQVVRTGSTGTTATTGAKGISKEDLRRASPDYGQLTQLDRHAAAAGSPARHAEAAQLRRTTVDELPAGSTP